MSQDPQTAKLPTSFAEYSALCTTRGVTPSLTEQQFGEVMAKVGPPGEDMQSAIARYLAASEDDNYEVLGFQLHLQELAAPGSTGMGDVLCEDKSAELGGGCGGCCPKPPTT
jgi:hypothetical protein